MGTAEARMACCSEGDRCPMHTSHSDDSTAVSQVEADRCCAASERRDSAPSASAFVPAIVQGVVATPVPFAAPELRPHRDAWRTLVPISATAVPKHLLLSVFLI